MGGKPLFRRIPQGCALGGDEGPAHRGPSRVEQQIKQKTAPCFCGRTAVFFYWGFCPGEWGLGLRWERGETFTVSSLLLERFESISSV